MKTIINEQITNMKAKKQIEAVRNVIPLRSMTAQAATMLLAFATVVIPARAADGQGASGAEDPNAIHPFHIKFNR